MILAEFLLLFHNEIKIFSNTGACILCSNYHITLNYFKIALLMCYYCCVCLLFVVCLFFFVLFCFYILSILKIIRYLLPSTIKIKLSNYANRTDRNIWFIKL